MENATSNQAASADGSYDNSAAADAAWLSPAKTGLYFVLGNLLPSAGLLLMLRGTPMPPSWQSGALHDYVTYLLSAQAAALFYPFFFYSIACFTLALFQPQTARRRFLVRFGVYSGVLLAVQYCFVTGIVLLRIETLRSWNGVLRLLAIPLAGLALVAVPWLAMFLSGLLKKRLERMGGRRVWVTLLMFAAPTIAVLLGYVPSEAGADEWVFAAVVIPGIAVVVAAPVWMAAVFIDLSRRFRSSQARPAQWQMLQLLGVFSWLAAIMAAWRFAIVQTIEAYAALPTTPPSRCYIATAAAQGHSSIVRSWTIRCSDGTLCRVNMQLAYFKCGELALRAVSPRWHGKLRRGYDLAGPIMARAIVSPFAADAAYFMLKPSEWMVRLVFAVIGGRDALTKLGQVCNRCDGQSDATDGKKISPTAVQNTPSRASFSVGQRCTPQQNSDSREK